jgi:hypothetical protein
MVATEGKGLIKMYCIIYQEGRKLNDFERGTLAEILNEFELSSFEWRFAGSLGNELKYKADQPGMAAYVRPSRDPNSIMDGV